MTEIFLIWNNKLVDCCPSALLMCKNTLNEYESDFIIFVTCFLISLNFITPIHLENLNRRFIKSIFYDRYEALGLATL